MRSWAVQSSRVRGPSFPPVSLRPTRCRHRPRGPRRWAEYTLDQPSQPGRGLGELVDVHALGEGATVGMAQLGRGAAGVVGVDRDAPLGAEHQVQLDRMRWPAGLHPTQPDRGGLPHGQAQPGLLAAVTAQRLDGERRQGEDGAAGSGLDRPDGQLLAPANDPVHTPDHRQPDKPAPYQDPDLRTGVCPM
jgi:hypothetical protein